MSSNGFKLFKSAVAPGNEIHVTVPKEEGGDWTFVFGMLDGETHRRYFDILLGRAGQRKGNSIKAVQFMFKQKCQDVRGLTDEERQWLDDSKKTFKEVMLGDPDYALLMDAIIGRYITAAIPDADSSKSS